MSELQDWHSRGIDVTTPSIARIYDYILGGKDNFDIDRTAADKLFETMPEAAHMARANRLFLQRVVRLCAEAGIDQFVDVGTGVPTYPAVHDVALEVNPQAKVVYVDNDPVALAHARALMANMDGNEDRVAVIEADMRQPHSIIDHEKTQQFIDWDRPVAVLMLLMLHATTDDDDPAGIVAAFRGRMAPGSYAAVTHITGDAAPREDVERVEGIFNNASSTVTCRSSERVRGMLDGFTLVEPGVEFVESWRPDLPPPTPDMLLDRSWVYAALGKVSRS